MKGKILLIALAMSLIFVMAASALDVSSKNILFGGPNQERNETVTRTLNITNNLNKTINISISGCSGELEVSDRNLNNIANDTSRLVNLTYTIPVNASYKRTSLCELTIVAKNFTDGTELSKETVKIDKEAESNLQIRSITFDIKGDRTDRTGVRVGDGSRIRDIRPDDKIDVRIEVRNLDSDLEMDPVVLRIESSDTRYVDLDDRRITIGRVRERSSETELTSIYIMDDARDTSYYVTFLVEGEDENKALHGEEWEVELDVDFPRDEITILSANVLPTTVECGREATVSVNIKNTGSRDQEEVVLGISIPTINYHETITDIELWSMETELNRFIVPIPETTSEGLKLIQLFVRDDNGRETHTKDLEIFVTCPEDEPEPEVPVVPVTPTEPDDDQPPYVVDTVEQSFLESPTFIILLVGLNVIIILLVIFAGIMLLRKK